MKRFILVFLLVPTHALAAGKVVLSESVINKMIAEEPPNVQQINASFLSRQSDYRMKKDQLDFRVDGEAKYYKSDEKLLNNFDGGVTRNSSLYTIGIVKPTRYGADIGVKVFSNKATNAFVSDAATTGASVSLSIDLFKNLLGRKTNSDLKKGALSVKRGEYEKKINLKMFETNVRKLYWALVANNEQRKLLEAMVKTSEKQYRVAARRKKSGVADSGELARFRSQWSLRKANLLSLNYQKANSLRALKELLPELSDKDVVLGDYNVEETIAKVLACTEVIGAYKEAPLKYTYYDEIVGLLAKEEELELKSLRTYDSPDLKLTGEYSTVGRDFGMAESRENFFDDSRPRSSVGLQLSIPLGGRRNTEKILKKIAKSNYAAQMQSDLAKVRAYHGETLRMVDTLRKVVQNQKETNKYLGRSLSVSRRKYRQARISIQELIGEQEAHYQSQLSEIDSNLAIVNTLVDYFGIYIDTPCKFNRI